MSAGIRRKIDFEGVCSPLLLALCCFLYVCACVCVCVSVCVKARRLRKPLQPVQTDRHTHSHPLSHCWPVSKVITGRLLHAFMKYSNGSVSYCALIMPHKDKKGGWGGEDRQAEDNNEGTPYLLKCGWESALGLWK